MREASWSCTAPRLRLLVRMLVSLPLHRTRAADQGLSGPTGTPDMLGYGVSKAATHHIVKSAACVAPPPPSTVSFADPFGAWLATAGFEGWRPTQPRWPSFRCAGCCRGGAVCRTQPASPRFERAHAEHLGHPGQPSRDARRGPPPVDSARAHRQHRVPVGGRSVAARHGRHATRSRNLGRPVPPPGVADPSSRPPSGSLVKPDAVTPGKWTVA